MVIAYDFIEIIDKTTFNSSKIKDFYKILGDTLM